MTVRLILNNLGHWEIRLRNFIVIVIVLEQLWLYLWLRSKQKHSYKIYSMVHILWNGNR